MPESSRVEIPYTQLQRDTVYRVDFSDCCVEGHVLMTYLYHAGEEDCEEFTFLEGLLSNKATDKIRFFEA